MAKLNFKTVAKGSAKPQGPGKQKKDSAYDELEIHYTLKKSGPRAFTYDECDEDGNLVDQNNGEGKSGSFYVKRTAWTEAPQRIVVIARAYEE